VYDDGLFEEVKVYPDAQTEGLHNKVHEFDNVIIDEVEDSIGQVPYFINHGSHHS
jgi:hypothetical protein